MLYGWARFGLFWLINIFAVIIGKTAILGIIGTMIPRIALYDNPELLSFFSWLIPAWLLTWLFIDDAKRHTAYGLYNPTAVTIIMLLTAIVYYIPVFTLDYMQDRKVLSSVESLYFTSYWLSAIDDDPQVYGLIGTILQAIMCVGSYLLAHKFYLKRFLDEEDEEG